MDFDYTPEQAALIGNIADFVSEIVNPALGTKPDPHHFDRKLWKQCAQYGLLACGMPEPWGWSDRRDYLSTILVLESIGYTCCDNALPFGLAAQGCTVQHTLLHHGNEQQIKRYLPGCIAGELIGSHAMTEPAAGSDSSAVALTATPCEGGYHLNGEKLMITLAPVADFHVVFATVNPAAGRWGITCFIIDRDNPGLNVSCATQKMGLERIPMGSLQLKDCFVPVSARLGPEGAGAAIAFKSLEVERTAILASQVGRMRRQLESAVRHTRQRKQFGKPIEQFQAVSHRLADMRLRLESAQLLLYKTAWKLDQNDNATLESSMLKLHISESFLESSMDAMRIYGGYAYIDDHHSGTDTRDALGGVLYAGTSDIQRNIIAGLLDS